jgi:hypothetical protein
MIEADGTENKTRYGANTSVWENGNNAISPAEETYSKPQNDKIIKDDEPVKDVPWESFK